MTHMQDMALMGAIRRYRVAVACGEVDAALDARREALDLDDRAAIDAVRAARTRAEEGARQLDTAIEAVAAAQRSEFAVACRLSEARRAITSANPLDPKTWELERGLGDYERDLADAFAVRCAAERHQTDCAADLRRQRAARDAVIADTQERLERELRARALVTDPIEFGRLLRTIEGNA